MRAIGIFIDRTGILDLRSALYGDNTASQIISGKKFRCSAEINIQTAIFNISLKNTKVYTTIYNEVQELQARFNESGTKECLNNLPLATGSCDLFKKVKRFDETTERTKTNIQNVPKIHENG